jgi:hypothetical protein
MAALYALVGAVVGIGITEAMRRMLRDAGGRPARVGRPTMGSARASSGTEIGSIKHPSCHFAAQDYYDR